MVATGSDLGALSPGRLRRPILGDSSWTNQATPEQKDAKGNDMDMDFCEAAQKQYEGDNPLQGQALAQFRERLEKHHHLVFGDVPPAEIPLNRRLWQHMKEVHEEERSSF